MVTVELRQLRKEASAAVRFLQSKVDGKMQVHGSEVVVEDESAAEIRLQLRKFLHEQHVANYRVVSSKGRLEVVPIKERYEKGEDKMKGVPPFPPLSSERLPLMDVVYPNYLADKIRIDKQEKKLKALANR